MLVKHYLGFEGTNESCFSVTILFAFQKYLRSFSMHKQHPQVPEISRSAAIWGGYRFGEIYATPACCQGLQIV